MHAGRISWKKWSDANFDWYFLCTKLNGWIDLARITFLANETSTEEGSQLMLCNSCEYPCCCSGNIGQTDFLLTGNEKCRILFDGVL